MNNLNQLWIIEADDSLPPLSSQYQSVLSSFPNLPITVKSVDELAATDAVESPDLVFFHSNLTVIGHLQQFVQTQLLLPYSSFVIVSNEQDEGLCLLALEAGADDSITKKELTPTYLRKRMLLSGRRYPTKKALKYSREQLMACIQNTPNVAVQWYNARAEVLLWNHASEGLFGWTAEEAVGKTVDELIAIPENKNFWLDKIQQMASGKDPGIPKEWRFCRRNGEDRYCLSTLFPIPSFDGAPWFVCMDVDVTDLKQTENRLRQSEERYHLLFNYASDAIFIHDTDGAFLEVNEKACDVTGYTREQLLCMKVPDLFSAEELARRPLMWPELKRGERTSIERNMQRPDGKTATIEVTAKMFSPGRVMAIVRDVSERKKAEEALQQSEEKYRSLIEQQADAIALFDKEEKILDVNTSATQLLQYKREELRCMSLSAILWEEAVNDAVEFTALAAGASTIKQRRMKRKDGTPIETEVHIKHLFDGLFLASVRDLTERMDVQRQLKKEKEISDSIINSLPGLFYLYQPGVGYLRWNRQLEKTAGYSGEEIRHMTPTDFFDAGEKAKISRAIEKVFSEGENAVEGNLLTKDGRKIPYYFTGRFIHYDGKPAFLGTGIDLSDVKKLEHALSRQKIGAQKKVMQAMIDAEEKERNKLGLELHDNVNQILSVVRMYLSVLNDGEKVDGITLPKAAALLDDAITEIRQLSHSLAISYKFETGLAGTLEEMIENVKATKDFLVTLRLPPGLDKYTNGQQKMAIYRIVQEGLNNVIKYAKATQVKIGISLTSQDLELEIADNGQGFQPSKTAKGLGLNNISNRAEALDGTVEIDTAPGKGCRVKVNIPLKEGEGQGL